eukprot:8195-Chlamydomonas_euryale.AAC.4
MRGLAGASSLSLLPLPTMRTVGQQAYRDYKPSTSSTSSFFAGGPGVFPLYNTFLLPRRCWCAVGVRHHTVRAGSRQEEMCGGKACM